MIDTKRAVGWKASAYQSMDQVGGRPVVIEIASIGEALQAYIEGRLVDQEERLH